jgi:hypothetical protein
MPNFKTRKPGKQLNQLALKGKNLAQLPLCCGSWGDIVGNNKTRWNCNGKVVGTLENS